VIDTGVTRIDSGSIPVIDIAALVSGGDCPETERALRQAVQQAGFVYVRNHGIPETVIHNARACAMAFFLLRETIKSEVAVSEHHRGWLSAGGARMADDAPADLKESFVWGEERDTAQIPLDHSLRGPNRWPEQQLPEFRQHATEWFDCAQALAGCLLRAFARSLGVERNAFLRHSDRPLSRASFVYYPRQAASVNRNQIEPGQFGVGPHTDFGVMTVLCQDDVGGLQVENADGEWIHAPPIDGTLVVNVGDLLARWTNGAFRSARHRVTSPLGRDRLSLVLAFDPNPETKIDAREISPDATDCPEPVTCGDYLDWRFSQAFAYRRTRSPESDGASLPAEGAFDRAVEGARNLLLNCAQVCAGDRLLILHEAPALGWYDEEAPRMVARVARELGALVKMHRINGPDNRLLDGGVDEVASIDADYDCCIFFARVGDQLRFDRTAPDRKRVMSYVASLDVLASDYGRIEYRAMVDLKKAIDSLLMHASAIEISCPLGSDLRGSLQHRISGTTEEVSVLRFPVGVHVPIDASSFSGQVRLARYLTPTGSRVYDPAWIVIDEPVTAEVDRGRIVRYSGKDADVHRIERQYRQVARQFSLEPDVINSWHAGIHPGCRFSGHAADNPDRWSNTVFTSPRFVHFHTCGSDPPGEICWMVLDPTISINGVALWESGTLRLERFSETRRCLERWPCLQKLFADGNGEIGLPN